MHHRDADQFQLDWGLSLQETRAGYRLVQVKSRLVMFGGEDATGRIVDDVFVFDLDKVTWQHLQTT